MSDRGATAFLASAIRKPRAELQTFLSDPEKLAGAAKYHGIKPEWARFWITDELNRADRRH